VGFFHFYQLARIKMSVRIKKADGDYITGADLAVEADAVADLGAATAADLTDSSGGTANTTLESRADIATAGGATPAASDVDTAVNAVLVKIRNNFADLGAMVDKLTVDAAADRAKINALLAELRQGGAIAE
jgi:hypothetical protein